MKSLFDDSEPGAPVSLLQRLSTSVLGPPKVAASPIVTVDEVVPPSERRAAMSSLSDVEVKWVRAGLLIDAILSAFLTYYLATSHATRKVSYKVHGKTHYHLVPLSESWVLLGVLLLLCCGVGFLALQRRKRTLVAFSFFLTGFAFTLIFAPLGFALILLGGWLMMRAYRIQKYGTANAKMIAQGRAERSPRGARAPRGTPTKKSAASPGARKPPTASKRYTPKAPPRKKIPKPVD
ncbi:MAG TPA: hypothetical protein VNG12_11465 [Acidimicrobiales bacterium]|nr:hypothetical protein [Acidimicrobiales bacterium]